MVEEGLAVTVGPVVPLNPVAGDQLNDVAPLAVKVALFPLQIPGEDGLMLTIGEGVTFTVTDCVSLQLF